MRVPVRRLAEQIVERPVMCVVVGIRRAERCQFGPVIPVLRRFDPRRRQDLLVPGLDRFPALGHVAVPAQRLGAVGQSHGLPIARHLPRGIRAQRRRADDDRLQPRRAQLFVKPPQPLDAYLFAGETGVLAVIGQDAFRRIADKEGMAHGTHEVRVGGQFVLHVIGHVLEEYGGIRAQPQDHLADARVVGRMARLRLEILEGFVPRTDVVIIHEGLMQDSQIAPLPHDAFKGGRDGAGVAPERVNGHACEAAGTWRDCQRGALL